ncbi:MAG: DUF3800 domain-containing protein [Verrucomicrobia bacterium]|nr:DUF3800 domain-containing protein [Verrucomicrobiota bacterium]MCH8511742.1 DUF3800 domain-containing protein [Kiritimatiellia bacterium]
MGDVIHSYVDEAGDPILFGRKRGSGPIVGTEGCSNFFFMGKLEVDDPELLSSKLSTLRLELIADPYFAGVESFKPERKRTAHGFHANNDLPEVRYLVFKLLREMGAAVRFHAVIADKTILAREEMKRREVDPKARYQENSLYDVLIRELYGKFHRLADEYHIWVARRGKSDRNKALKEAIEHAERDFEARFGFSRNAEWHINVSDPNATVCLQAVDYFLWALQRFYERKEARFLDMMWPQIGEIHDLHHGNAGGVFFKGQDRPTLESAFPRKYEDKKKPRI